MSDVQATRKDACCWYTKSRGNPPRPTSANSPTLLARWGPYLSEPLTGLVWCSLLLNAPALCPLTLTWASRSGGYFLFRLRQVLTRIWCPGLGICISNKLPR